jgi:streptogramin lyase
VRTNPLTFSLLLLAIDASALPAIGAESLELHMVPTSIKSYRLLSMSMDDDGFIWCGSIHRVVHRYDPRTGDAETIQLPYDSSASSCLCVGKKVYILGQSYPKLIVYDRAEKGFTEFPYPSPKPDVWYGVGPIDGHLLYLFDRGSTGVIRWDAKTDSGTVIPYPYPGVLPSGGHYETADHAIWCKLWDYSTGQYIPHGIARLDLATDKFTGRWEFPKDPNDAGEKLAPASDVKHTFYLPWSLKGKLVPFDFKTRRWCKMIDVPRFGELFGFIGLSTPFRGKHYFSISTYDGDDLGVDGKPYHFCNALLEFDPGTQRFQYPALKAGEANNPAAPYYQVSYTMAAGDEFFATGSNIREADGALNQARPGECVFWQTKAAKKEGR